MQSKCTFTPYSETGYFSKIIVNYLNQDAQLKPFYNFEPSLQNIQQAIVGREIFPFRKNLTQILKDQYASLPVTDLVNLNISRLSEDNSFTITTAHQPNIFIGPLYVVYKILHVIRFANELSVLMPQYNFVPVFFMGSEDADLDELGTIQIDDKPYKWVTEQTGAVGRMRVDKKFIQLVNEIQKQLGVLPYGDELSSIFKQVYTDGKSIQQATLELINILFGDYGLVVLIPDNPQLKKLFLPVIHKELNELFSHKAAAQTIDQLKEHYRVQAAGRDINLFYLINNKRERIELSEDGFIIKALNLHFTKEEMMQEANQFPERFSPNVMLRGVLQEMVLPNLAFIGGGGEIAYWLELKEIFKAAGVQFPMLVLRNSFVVVADRWQKEIEALQIEPAEIFLPVHEIMKKVVLQNSKVKTDFNNEIMEIENLYTIIASEAGIINKSLQDHTLALKTKALKRLRELEKKILRSEKKKYAIEQEKFEKLKAHLFPGNSLQERKENFSGFYSRYSKDIFNAMLKHSTGLQQQFGVIYLLEK